MRVSHAFFLKIAGGLSVLLAASSISAQAVREFRIAPIPNQPFSAEIEITRTSTDGVKGSSFSHIARDAQGRTYAELRDFVDTDLNPCAPLPNVKYIGAGGRLEEDCDVHGSRKPVPFPIGAAIYDPTIQRETILNLRLKSYWQGSAYLPAAVNPDPLRIPVQIGHEMHATVTQEDLGSRTIEGVETRGVRWTRVLSAGDSPVSREVTVHDEIWHSDALGLDLMLKHDDPFTGTSTFTVRGLHQKAQDEKSFSIPKGYHAQSALPVVGVAGPGAMRTGVRGPVAAALGFDAPPRFMTNGAPYGLGPRTQPGWEFLKPREAPNAP